MNIQDLLLGSTDDLDVERLDDETLYALATYAGDLTASTSAIVELGGRSSARPAALSAARRLLASEWADKHLKSAAIDAAFRADPLAAVLIATSVLRTTREPILIDAMIRGVTADAGLLAEGEGRAFAQDLRTIAAAVEPDDRCDREVWEAFVGTPLASEATP